MTNAVAVRNESAALKAISDEMDRRRSMLEDSAASLIDPNRIKGVVLSVFSRRPELWECDPISVARAVVEAAQLGLEPTGAIGGAHLVPYNNSKTGRKEAQLIIDYRGMVQMARRSGEVAKVTARVVRERDEFDVREGTDDSIFHHPYLGTEDPGKYTHFYAVITYRNGTTQFDWDTDAWVQSIRKRSKSSDRGPWVTDYVEMGKKSILRRLMKMAPLTVEARRAIELDEESERDTPAVAPRPVTRSLATVREKLGITAVSADPEPTGDVPAPDEGEDFGMVFDAADAKA